MSRNDEIRRQLGSDMIEAQRRSGERNILADKESSVPKIGAADVEEEPSTVPTLHYGDAFDSPFEAKSTFKVIGWDLGDDDSWVALPLSSVNGYSGLKVKGVWMISEELSGQECSRHANDGAAPDGALHWNTEGWDL